MLSNRSQPLGLTNGKSKEGARGELRKKNYRRKKKAGQEKNTHPPTPSLPQLSHSLDSPLIIVLDLRCWLVNVGDI